MPAIATKEYRGNSGLNSGRGVLAGGVNPHGLEVALDNTNLLGPTTATTGFELRMPFADLGLPEGFRGRIALAACIQRTNGALSNQWLPTLVAGAADPGLAPNLGAIAGLQHVVLHIGVPGDLDGDGAVAGSDLALLLAAWAQSSADAGHLAADLSGDGFVDAADLAMLLASWGQGG
jgi:hypothetical protein